jgi:hypothetical protein
MRPDIKQLMAKYAGLRATEPTSRTQVISPDAELERALELTGLSKITDVYNVALLHLIDELQADLDELTNGD